MEEITAEYESGQLAPTTELRVRPKVSVACKTDLGRVRDNNEDKFEFYVPDDDATLAARGIIFVVCDGMGGHEAGQIASELAAKTFIDVYLNHPSNEPETAMRSAVAAANRFVGDVARTVPGRKGMGTTLSVLILLQDKAYTVHVGDSRIYRLRSAGLQMLTEDHTWADEAVRRGLITSQEAETHPYRHVLTRAIGTDGDVVPDVVCHDLALGDIFLLCSDGLVNHVSDAEIGDYLAKHTLAEAVWRLVGLALVNGGSDNCTVLAVRVDELAPSQN